jgi:hypothetical protein
MKGTPGSSIKLLPCDHEFKSWKQTLAEKQGKAAYIRTKVVGPSLDPTQAVHLAALLMWYLGLL